MRNYREANLKINLQGSIFMSALIDFLRRVYEGIFYQKNCA